MFERYIHDEYEIKEKTVTTEQWSYFLNNLSTVDLDSLTTGVLEFYTDYHTESIWN